MSPVTNGTCFPLTEEEVKEAVTQAVALYKPLEEEINLIKYGQGGKNWLTLPVCTIGVGTPMNVRGEVYRLKFAQKSGPEKNGVKSSVKRKSQASDNAAASSSSASAASSSSTMPPHKKGRGPDKKPRKPCGMWLDASMLRMMRMMGVKLKRAGGGGRSGKSRGGAKKARKPRGTWVLPG